MEIGEHQMYNPNGKKQKPKPLPTSAFGSADAPAVRTIQSNTSYQVIINGMKSGSYHFAIASGSAGVTIAVDVPLTNTSCISNVSTISAASVWDVINEGGDDNG